MWGRRVGQSESSKEKTPNPEGQAPSAPLAQLQPDMVPALNRRDAAPSSAMAPAVTVPPEVLAVAPEIIPNPTPSPEPILTNPQKE